MERFHQLGNLPIYLKEILYFPHLLSCSSLLEPSSNNPQAMKDIADGYVMRTPSRQLMLA